MSYSYNDVKNIIWQAGVDRLPGANAAGGLSIEMRVSAAVALFIHVIPGSRYARAPE
jgi:hypothetical protein